MSGVSRNTLVKDNVLEDKMLDLCHEIVAEIVRRNIQACHRVRNTAKNTVISPNYLVWKFCGKAQFPHSLGRITRNHAETVPFHKISKPGN